MLRIELYSPKSYQRGDTRSTVLATSEKSMIMLKLPLLGHFDHWQPFCFMLTFFFKLVVLTNIIYQKTNYRHPSKVEQVAAGLQTNPISFFSSTLLVVGKLEQHQSSNVSILSLFCQPEWLFVNNFSNFFLYL